MKKIFFFISLICIISTIPMCVAAIEPYINIKYTDETDNSLYVEAFEAGREIEIKLTYYNQNIGFVVVAYYDKNDSLVDMKSDRDVFSVYETTMIPDDTIEYIKVFAWDSLETMQPLMDYYILYKIQENQKPLGNGTVDDAYRITNEKELAYIFVENKANYILENDIDLNQITWRPMLFRGVFDGQGHSIKGVRIADNSLNGGFVSSLIPPTRRLGELPIDGEPFIDSYIMNLNVEIIDIGKDTNHAGGIAAYMEAGAYIINCSSLGSITINQNGVAGGVVGSAYGGEIEDCTNYANIRCYGTCEAIVGGIAGFTVLFFDNKVSFIKNCESNGEMRAYASGEFEEYSVVAGGIVGNNNGYIRNCTSNVKLHSDGKLGGIIGDRHGFYTEIKDCIDNSIAISE